MYNTTRTRLPPMVNLLIRYGADCKGRGLLTWVIATLSSYPVDREVVWAMEIMAQLIRAGVDINEVPPEYKDECPPYARQPPLIAAALSGSGSIIFYILAHNPDIHIRHSESGKTAYECAYEAFEAPEDLQRRDQVMSIFAESGISPATMWGILDSEHPREHPRYCRCSTATSELFIPDPELRYMPVLKPLI